MHAFILFFLRDCWYKRQNPWRKPQHTLSRLFLTHSCQLIEGFQRFYLFNKNALLIIFETDTKVHVLNIYIKQAMINAINYIQLFTETSIECFLCSSWMAWSTTDEWRPDSSAETKAIWHIIRPLQKRIESSDGPPNYSVLLALWPHRDKGHASFIYTNQ